MTTEELISRIRVIPDFPTKGIMFQDVTTLFKDPDCLSELSDRIYDLYKDKGITKVVGIESRGFVLGAIVASRLGAGFVPARKPGKLPAEKFTAEFAKEYATGGSFAAANDLVRMFNPAKVYLNCIINLKDCPRRPNYPADLDLTSIIEINEFQD